MGRFHQRINRAIVAVALVGGLAGSTVAVVTVGGSASAAGTPNTSGPPTTTHSVQPSYHAGTIASCPSGTITFINTSKAPNGAIGASYSQGGTSFVATVDPAQKYLSFTTNSPGFTVYVKGGSSWDTYDYTTTGYSSDTGLHSPLNGGGNVATIGHYLVCGVIEPLTVSVQSPNPILLGFASGFLPGSSITVGFAVTNPNPVAVTVTTVSFVSVTSPDAACQAVINEDPQQFWLTPVGSTSVTNVPVPENVVIAANATAAALPNSGVLNWANTNFDQSACGAANGPVPVTLTVQTP